MRLACIYALLDLSETITPEHLNAALAVWRYAEDSARFIFGDALGDPVADEILLALRRSSNGMTRTELSGLFSRNVPASALSRACSVLLSRGLARNAPEATGGRPTERWFAC